jgi:hypothetical protein
MGLHRRFGDEQLGGDLSVGQSRRDLGEHVGLARGKPAGGPVSLRTCRDPGQAVAEAIGVARHAEALPPHDGLDQSALDGRFELSLARPHNGQRLEDVLGPGVLGEEAPRAGAQRGEDRFIIGVTRQHHYRDARSRR